VKITQVGPGESGWVGRGASHLRRHPGAVECRLGRPNCIGSPAGSPASGRESLFLLETTNTCAFIQDRYWLIIRSGYRVRKPDMIHAERPLPYQLWPAMGHKAVEPGTGGRGGRSAMANECGWCCHSCRQL